MRRILSVLTACLALTSCELDTSHNGDLDGFWLLTTVDTLATGGHADVRTNYLTWSFQGHLLELRALEGGQFMVVWRFEHTDDSLKLYSPFYTDNGHKDSVLTEVTESLRLFGINRMDEGYRVMTLNSDDMLLQSEKVVLRFKKY